MSKYLDERKRRSIKQKSKGARGYKISVGTCGKVTSKVIAPTSGSYLSQGPREEATRMTPDPLARFLGSVPSEEIDALQEQIRLIRELSS